jgi:hypothetical protein
MPVSECQVKAAPSLRIINTFCVKNLNRESKAISNADIANDNIQILGFESVRVTLRGNRFRRFFDFFVMVFPNLISKLGD